jgi:hypothetical protein
MANENYFNRPLFYKVNLVSWGYITACRYLLSALIGRIIIIIIIIIIISSSSKMVKHSRYRPELA